ncbi:MAG: ABC transporter permease subunit [Chloroflexota bacterium]|nr:ABC transporter permease subunit [Chloroflexota bacterium]
MLCQKEWMDLYRNRRVLWITVSLPAVLLLMGVAGMWGVQHLPEAELMDDPPPVVGITRFAGLEVRERVQAAVALQFLLLFLLVPMLIPISTAAYSVVGEKRDRSLEPLLVTPLHTGEILVGKAVAALAPGMAVTLLAYGIYAALTSLWVAGPRVYQYVLGPVPAVLLLLIGPLLGLMGVGVALIVSSRSSDPRAAEQTSSLLVLPLMGVFVAQILGLVQLSLALLLGVGLLLAVLDLVLFRVAARLFQRGEILSRWG